MRPKFFNYCSGEPLQTRVYFSCNQLDPTGSNWIHGIHRIQHSRDPTGSNRIQHFWAPVGTLGTLGTRWGNSRYADWIQLEPKSQISNPQQKMKYRYPLLIAKVRLEYESNRSSTTFSTRLISGYENDPKCQKAWHTITRPIIFNTKNDLWKFF